MSTPHYKSILAQQNECLPDAQAGMGLYFMGKTQAATTSPIPNPGMSYFDRVHLFQPMMAKGNYHAKGQIIGDDREVIPLGRSLDERLYGHMGSLRGLGKSNGVQLYL